MSTETEVNILPVFKGNPINTYDHMKRNIVKQAENCQDPITENSQYCVNCKKNSCTDCDLDTHKEHHLIPQKKIYQLEDSYMDQFILTLTNVEDLETWKKEALDSLEKNFVRMRSELHSIYEAKKKEIDDIFGFSLDNITKVKKNLRDLQVSLKDFYQKHEPFFCVEAGTNYDVQNTIFLMKLDLLDNTAHLNNKTNKAVTSLRDKLANMQNEITNSTDEVVQYMHEKFKEDLDPFIKQYEVKNFYVDLNTKIKTFNEQIDRFKSTICRGYNKSGSFKHLEDVVNKLDAKNKRQIDDIYNQKTVDYNESNYNLQKKMSSSSLRENQENSPEKLNYNKSKSALSKYSDLIDGKLSRYSSSGKLIRSKSSTSVHAVDPKTPDQITLEVPIVQRFFAYFMLEIIAQFTTKRAIASSSDSNQKNSNSERASIKRYSQYQERLAMLKEFAKPIIGKNEIAVYNELTREMRRVKLDLKKDEHGYTVFPEGVRHIVIKNLFFIIGGVDQFGNPIKTCLVYNLATLELKKINDTMFPHSYHTIEYLDNYDCLIVLGGERNTTCEMFDLNKRTWNTLPDLAYPRANISAFFNEQTNELYAMFGMTGNITKKKNFTEAIEVLKICDSSNGWIKVDYYKNSMIDLNSAYIQAFPFTSDKLIIRGAKNNRIDQVTFTIFDMVKNEMSFASEKTIRLLQEEEIKMQHYKNSLKNKKK